MGFSVKWNL